MLNKLQQEAMNSVLAIKNDRVTVLTGEAGSGKTFTASRIAEDFKGSVLVTATTNKSSSVLRKDIGMDAKTIQSAMGYRLKWLGTNKRLVQERPPEAADLIIVDEVSMLPAEVYTTLLSTSARKILFLGDPVQLEGIGSSVDINNIQGTHIELTEQMRQTSLSPATTKYFADLRNSIETASKPPKFPKNSPDLILVDDHEEFADRYHSETGTKKIITYRNACANSYNRHISGGSRLFEPGDKCVIGAPVGDNRNGDILTVTVVDDHPGHMVVTLSNDEDVVYWKSKAAMDRFLEPLAIKKSWKKYHEIKNKSVDLKHLFSCTAHKSQGSTYDVVFLDGTDIVSADNNSMYSNPITQNQMMRLAYVAMSRMRKKVVIFTSTSRDYKKFRRAS